VPPGRWCSAGLSHPTTLSVSRPPAEERRRIAGNDRPVAGAGNDWERFKMWPSAASANFLVTAACLHTQRESSISRSWPQRFIRTAE